MESIIDALRSTARQVEPLLDTLTRTEYALSALEQQKRRVKELDSQLSKTRDRVRMLGNEKERERREYKEYHNSVIERWLYKVSGHKAEFDAIVEKRRIKYGRILRQLYQAKMTERDLLNMGVEALRTQYRLEEDSALYATARMEFDALYTSIFRGGISPSPEVDDAERSVERAVQACKDSRTRLTTDQEVEGILKQANRSMRSSLYKIEATLHALQDRLFSRSANFNHMKRVALLGVIEDIYTVQKDISRAQQISSKVQDVPAVNIPVELRIDSRHIKDFYDEVRRYKQAVGAQFSAASERSLVSRQQVTLDSEQLEAATRDLQKERQRLFRHLANDDLYEAPPQYSP